MLFCGQERKRPILLVLRSPFRRCRSLVVFLDAESGLLTSYSVLFPVFSSVLFLAPVFYAVLLSLSQGDLLGETVGVDEVREGVTCVC